MLFRGCACCFPLLALRSEAIRSHGSQPGSVSFMSVRDLLSSIWLCLKRAAVFFPEEKD
jgi:hypothetical protein